jgi:hypothetical protein
LRVVSRSMEKGPEGEINQAKGTLRQNVHLFAKAPHFSISQFTMQLKNIKLAEIVPLTLDLQYIHAIF